MTFDPERRALVVAAAHLASRGLAPGSSGNISLRLAPDRYLMTPTNASLHALDPMRLAVVDASGMPVEGDRPTKEAALHLAVYDRRSEAAAVIHLHAPYSVALACLEDADPLDALPRLTPYAVMRVGALPIVPYAPPGDPRLARAVASYATEHHAMLLANHGPVVAGTSLDAAVAISEELEEVAKLFFVLRGYPTRMLSQSDVDHLRATQALR